MPDGDFVVADVAIAAVVALSAVFGVLRGFVKEVVSLVIWVTALLLGTFFGAFVGEMMGLDLAPRLQTAVGFAAIFVVVLVAGALLQRLLHGLVESTGLTGTDRMLGLLFGAGRGIAVVVVGLIVLRPFAEERAWWSESRLAPPLLAFEDDMLSLVDYVSERLAGTGDGPAPTAEEVVL